MPEADNIPEATALPAGGVAFAHSEARAPGRELHDLVAELYPLCRSITGDGVRETLARLGRIVPLATHALPSGTPVLDWTIPPEWNIRDAWIADRHGRRVVDFRRSNLHVVGYSVPVRRRMSLAELRPHLHTLPGQPDWIPYRTSYYKEDWGFCLSQRALEALPEGDYEVCIDATLTPGELVYGEALVRGATDEEIFVSCHICHPSLANDNLSGVAVAAHLAREVGSRPRRYTYRFVFVPGTIGAIAWLSRNAAILPRIRHGLVLSCLGDAGPLTYKRSRRGDSAIDGAAARVLRAHGPHRILPFSPDGYDERQYCSPGFDLPVGRLSRSPAGTFPEYHTSADDLSLVSPDHLAASLAACRDIFAALEGERFFVNRSPYGEPQLGRRGLYRALGGEVRRDRLEAAILWVLNLADGRHGLTDIAERAGLPVTEIEAAAATLIAHGLIEETAGALRT
ncbi:MAG: DUF4910 domain-containing protein [Burkholderiales bacterium]|nr:DUF4910 domain-containing protein [Burkholderiales bacterium]